MFRPDGLPIWVSQVEPGSVHDLTAAREHVLGARYAAAAKGLPTLADPGDEGAGQGVHTPVKQPADGTELDLNTRTRNALLRAVRCLGERGFALLTGRWRTLQHVTVSPSKITKIARAALVLTHFEHGYCTFLAEKTSLYAAPEQRRAQRATATTDVYAFGVTAFELLTGRWLFEGPDFHDQHLHRAPQVCQPGLTAP